MKDFQAAVYILSNKSHSTLYVGVTSNLIKRTWQHKQHVTGGFTDKYNVDKLVYFELHDSMYEAITREKRLKKWRRAWKLALINELNPDWKDLYVELLG